MCVMMMFLRVNVCLCVCVCVCVNRMFARRRWIPATLVVLSILGTITIAIAAPSGAGGLIILLILVQWGASLWYCLTYIPFGEKMAGSMLSRIGLGGGGGG